MHQELADAAAYEQRRTETCYSFSLAACRIKSVSFWWRYWEKCGVLSRGV